MTAPVIEVDFEFPAAGLSGLARAFSQEECETYIDHAMRQRDDAAVWVLRRFVTSPGFEVIEEARRDFPELAQHVADGLCEVAGCYRQTATTEDALDFDTPPGVLAFAGLDAAKVTELKTKFPTTRLVLITVCNDDCERLAAFVVRAPDEGTLRLISKARADKKGFAKAARSASLNVIVWSSEPAKEVFERYPALPALVLGPRIIEIGDRSADARFRRR